MNTNMTGQDGFQKKSLHPCALDQSSLSIGGVNSLSASLNDNFGLVT